MEDTSKKLKLPENSDEISLSDEEIDGQNKNYFIQRVHDLGTDAAIKEYSKHFGMNNKRKYSIKKK